MGLRKSKLYILTFTAIERPVTGEINSNIANDCSHATVYIFLASASLKVEHCLNFCNFFLQIVHLEHLIETRALNGF